MFQITVFIILFAAMILVKRQVHYVFTKDHGFVKEGLIMVSTGDNNYETFKQEILKNPGVVNVSGITWTPFSGGKMEISMPKVDQPDEMANVVGFFADYELTTTMGLKLMAGEGPKRPASAKLTAPL